MTATHVVRASLGVRGVCGGYSDRVLLLSEVVMLKEVLLNEVLSEVLLNEVLSEVLLNEVLSEVLLNEVLSEAPLNEVLSEAPLNEEEVASETAPPSRRRGSVCNNSLHTRVYTALSSENNSLWRATSNWIAFSLYSTSAARCTALT